MLDTLASRVNSTSITVMFLYKYTHFLTKITSLSFVILCGWFIKYIMNIFFCNCIHFSMLSNKLLQPSGLKQHAFFFLFYGFHASGVQAQHNWVLTQGLRLKWKRWLGCVLIWSSFPFPSSLGSLDNDVGSFQL